MVERRKRLWSLHPRHYLRSTALPRRRQDLLRGPEDASSTLAHCPLHGRGRLTAGRQAKNDSVIHPSSVSLFISSRGVNSLLTNSQRGADQGYSDYQSKDAGSSPAGSNCGPVAQPDRAKISLVAIILVTFPASTFCEAQIRVTSLITKRSSVRFRPGLSCGPVAQW